MPEMQGEQKTNRGAYIKLIERCGMQCNAADERFAKPFGFYRQKILLFIIAPLTGEAPPVNSQ
jgi:hypothetical protein